MQTGRTSQPKNQILSRNKVDRSRSKTIRNSGEKPLMSTKLNQYYMSQAFEPKKVQPAQKTP